MAIRYYNLKNITPLSKPRGQLGKFGNMTHSSGNYRKFQQEVYERLTELTFAIPGDFFALAYIFYMGRKKGRANDVGNMVGAIEDVLVKYKYLKDDSWLHLPRAWQEAVASDVFGITLLVLESASDIVYFMSARDRLLSQFREPSLISPR